MNVRCFLWGILFITVSSCIESDRIMHYAQFEHTINLKSDRIQVPSVLLYPRSLVLCDSNLIVFNEKMDTMFQCFHLCDRRQRQMCIRDSYYPCEISKERFCHVRRN